MSLNVLREFLDKYVPIINDYIMNRVKGYPEFLYDAALHLIKAGGKRLRPSLTLLSTEMLCEDYKKALPAAAAIELIHNFTLVHDDIMDQDEFRRGVPTVHTVWDVPTAIIAGDLLFSKAFELLYDLSSRGVSHDRIVEVSRILAEATSIIAEGQALDMDFEKRWDIGVEDYLDMIRKKTATLIEASVATGAIIAGASREDLEYLKQYGRSIGMAFQIRDDILGVFGDPAKTGKPVYNDIREGKKTILVIYVLENGGEKEKRILKERLGNKNLGENEYREVAEIMEKTGALEYATDVAKRYMEEAINSLKSLTSVCNEKAREALIELARYVVEREK